MKKILSMLAVLAMVSVGLVAGSVSASAHVPDKSVSCTGVTGSGTNYNKHDTITVSVGSVTRSDTFGRTGQTSVTVPVPQDGEVYDWHIKINSSDDYYDRNWTGTVGPCGETTPDSKKIQFCHWTEGGHYNFLDTSKNAFYVGHREHAKDIYPAGSIKKQGKTFSWDAQGDQSLLSTNCETAPDSLITHNSTESTDCSSATVTIHHSTTTTRYVWDETKGEYVAGTPVTVDEPDTTREATLQECPAPEYPGIKVVVTHTTENPVCDNGNTVVVTHWTRTTTDYKLVDRTWVAQTPKVENWDSREVVEQSVCPTPTETVTPTPSETVTPPVTSTTTAPAVTKTPSPTVTTPANQLAYTGFNAWIWAGIGAALILAGTVLLFGRKYTLDRKH